MPKLVHGQKTTIDYNGLDRQLHSKVQIVKKIQHAKDFKEDAELQQQIQFFNPETMEVGKRVLVGTEDEVGLWDDSHVYKVLMKKMRDIQNTCLDENKPNNSK